MTKLLTFTIAVVGLAATLHNAIAADAGATLLGVRKICERLTMPSLIFSVFATSGSAFFGKAAPTSRPTAPSAC